MKETSGVVLVASPELNVSGQPRPNKAYLVRSKIIK